MPGPVADAEVGAAFVEARQRGFGIEGQADARMLGREVGQARQQPGVGERVQGGDADAVFLVAIAAQRAQRDFHVGERAAGGVGQAPAFGGERHAARVALEQRDAQARFELADVVADRAGREVQFLGGVGEVLVAGGRFERGEGREPIGAQDHGEPQI